MAENLFWFYDVFTVGILLIFLYQNSKKGFVRSVVYTVLIIASFLISWFAAEVLSPFIYDSCIKEAIVSKFEENADQTDKAHLIAQAISSGNYGVEMTEAEISDILQNDPDFFDSLISRMRENGAQDNASVIESGVKESVAEQVLNNMFRDTPISGYVSSAASTLTDITEKLENVVQTFVSGTTADTARAVEENFVAPVIKWLLKALIFIVLIFILRFVINPVSNAFKFVNKVPVVGPINAVLGALFGLVEGLIFMYVTAILVKAVVSLTGDSLIFLNSETIEQSKLFVLLYNFDVLSFL